MMSASAVPPVGSASASLGPSETDALVRLRDEIARSLLASAVKMSFRFSPSAVAATHRPPFVRERPAAASAPVPAEDFLLLDEDSCSSREVDLLRCPRRSAPAASWPSAAESDFLIRALQLDLGL